MEFADVVAHCRTLAAQIQARAGPIDGLIGVSRGGWVPARLLSSLLCVKRIYSIGLEYADAERKRLVCYDDPAHALVSPSILLVVEDCLETGRALAFAKEHLGLRGHTVLTAALFITPRSQFIPDFHAARLDAPPTFPWEV